MGLAGTNCGCSVSGLWGFELGSASPTAADPEEARIPGP